MKNTKHSKHKPLCFVCLLCFLRKEANDAEIIALEM